jgi:SAM-dependent methyltransferase
MARIRKKSIYESQHRWPELVCPEDGRQLTSGKDGLVCPANHRWRIEAGIPRLLSQTRNYADAFGLQWRTYRRTQLDSYTGLPLSQERARRCLGEECWRILQRSETRVLEVGCGAGRFTEVLLSTGANVTSVDMSPAVEANQENCPQDEHHRVLQADVLHLPFRPAQYDIVFCLGVIQHTPNPEQTIERLYEQVRPGGWLVIDHYTATISEFTKSAFLFRLALTRLTPERGMIVSEWLVNTLLPVHKAVRNRPVLRRLLTRVSPVLTYYHALPLEDKLQREWALLDTHDSLTDKYKHFRTKGQIRRTLVRLGAQAIWCEHGGNGVEVRCRRPAAAD